MHIVTRIGRVVLVASVLSLAATGWANHIDTALDIPGTRTSLGRDEGYLSFHILGGPATIFPAGEERTGWTDIRAPWYFNGGVGNANNQLTTNTSLGYDRSDREILVNNTIITHTNNGAAANQTAAPNVPADYNYANQIYQQIGISVVSTGIANANAAVPNAMGAPPAPNAAGMTDSDRVLGVNRSASPTVNNAYVVGYAGGSPVGFTISPEDTPAGGMGNVRPNSGIIVTNTTNPDTFAHELGHFVLDQFTFAGGNVHSPAANDLMATSAGNFRNIPNANQKGGGNTAPSNPGEPNGNLGGVDRFTANVTAGGGPATDQARAVYNAESDGTFYVQKTTDLANAPTYGDRADFDWVEDSYRLENIGGNADNHAGAESMYFQIGVNAGSGHTDAITGAAHNHGNWGELNLPGFTGTSFNFADVVSQIARYSDMDVDAAGNWSARESALDYLLAFSADGTNWFDGIPIAVFVQGWTTRSDAENYLARWEVPDNILALGGAQFIRITADNTDGHDGNTQIDAIIVSTVPEPSTLVLALLAAVPALARRRRNDR